MRKEKINVVWFRRDLRLTDNRTLLEAHWEGRPVLPVFIFDKDILEDLPRQDARVTFIHQRLTALSDQLSEYSSGIICFHGKPADVWKDLLSRYDINCVYAGEDYEPYARRRDDEIKTILDKKGVELKLIKDQVIFSKSEIVKGDGLPYTVYTPYKRKWMSEVTEGHLEVVKSEHQNNYYKVSSRLPSLDELGFEQSNIEVRDYDLNDLDNYDELRNFPARDKTSHLSVHLRFGTVSIREVIQRIRPNESFLSELIWREFFMQILYHFPKVINSNFKEKYDHVKWRNDPDDFEKWKHGMTGYPMVDAGMRELNATGYMHNRVRMVVAGFLCKHLLIHWSWGEAYFAEKLLDYDLSANNGNWQWAAGTGCDAAPYFRVFNPTEQIRKFDKDLKYIRHWVPELGKNDYPLPMVDHKMARARALTVYKQGIEAFDLNSE